MSILESVLLALRQVWAHKLKSFFTLLGVIIGVTFLIAVIAVVEGMNRYVQDDFAGSIFGINTLQIHQRRTRSTGRETDRQRRQQSRNPYLTVEDAEALREQVPDLWLIAYNNDRIVPEVRSEDQQRRNVRLIGATPEYLALQGWDVESGRGLSQTDNGRRLRVAVIGTAIAEKLYPGLPAIGRDIRIGPFEYRVVGLLKRQGGLIGNIRDASVVIPFEAYRADFTYRRGRIEEISLKFRSEADMERGYRATEEILRRRHQLRPARENDFAIESASEILDAWRKINTVLLAALPGLVSIALIVGGIVIMNIMLMSVLERTREVGLRKALGARRGDITRQFVAEAATLSSVGAGLGVLLGAVVAQIVRALTPMPVSIALWSIILAIVLGLLVGIIAGAYPAIRAARLDPVVALRHE